MKARATLARKGIRGELGNKGKMIQGKAEGTEVRGAFGGKQVMTYIKNTIQGGAFIGNRITHWQTALNVCGIPLKV